MRLALCYDDVQIAPKFSEIESRKDVCLQTKVSKQFNMLVPLIAAPMDTVCEYDMAKAMDDAGAIGAVHRYMTIEEQCEVVQSIVNLKMGPFSTKHITQMPIAAAIGVNGDSQERFERLLDVGVQLFVIDVAHGHHKSVKLAMEWMNRHSRRSSFDVMAGSIATTDAAVELIGWGADALRVGVGGGSICTTRVTTGVGIPTLSSIMEMVPCVSVPIIADGGIRTPGDVSKALAAGASAVMIGSLFAGVKEAPGEIIVTGQWPNQKRMKVYSGLASATTKLKHTGKLDYVEGASKVIESKGSAYDIVKDILDGVRSSMSYVGATTIGEFHQKAEFIQITQAGLAEAHPHIFSR